VYRQLSYCIRITLCFCVWTLLAALAGGQESHALGRNKAASSSDGRKRNLVLRTDLPTAISTARTYTVKQSRADEVSVLRLAQKFFTNTVEAVEKRRNGYVCEGLIDGEPYTLALYLGHAFQFALNSPACKKIGQLRSESDDPLPSLEDSQSAALQFLKRYDLIPHDSFTAGVVDNSSAGCLSFGLGRKLDGIEFWGAGSKISVHVGPRMQILRLYVSWPELELAGEVEVVPPQRALGRARAGEGLFAVSGKQELQIDRMRLVYDSLPQFDEPVTPCYLFERRRSDADPSFGYLGIINATVKDEDSLVGSRESSGKADR